ncbi:MAG: YigZ family protein [Ferruginibacter sp.]
MEFYNTIVQTGQAELKDRGSKFIAYAFPIVTTDDVKKALATLKKEHPKAVHHCYAYRIGLDGNQFRVNDDGEPSGTAGKPILGQLDSKQVTNTCIVVVRYFGGTLLGVPGLIQAYKTAASLVLQVIPIVPKPVMKKYSVQFDYTQMNDIMLIVKQLNGTVLQHQQQLFSSMDVEIPKMHIVEWVNRINHLRSVTLNLLL